MEIAILFGLILLNALFAMSEVALITARKARLQKLSENGDSGARTAILLGDDPNKFLSTIQIGITSIGVLNGIVGEATLAGPVREWLTSVGMAMPYAGYVATGLVVMVITYFSIVLGELMPKRLGQIAPEFIASRVARPMAGLAKVVKPFVLLLSGSTDLALRLVGARNAERPAVTEEELHLMLAEGSDAGIIEQEEHQIVRNVFRLDDRQIASFMVPRREVVYFDVNLSREDNLARLEHGNHDRFPVLRGSWDDILGIADTRQLLAQALRGEALDLAWDLQPAVYVPEILTGLDLLEEFKRSAVEMVFVVDEYGDVQGIVTPRDLMEVIAGEFHTPQAEDSWSVQRPDGSWLLDGLIPTPELQDRLGLQALPEQERSHYHTLSGMVMLLLGKVPQTGDRCEWEKWTFEIVDLDGMRIDKVLATPRQALVENQDTGAE
jgi:putative hemolysin